MPNLAAIGVVVRDLSEAARFYRLLGVDVPESGGDHLEAPMPNRLRLGWDTIELMQQLDPERSRAAIGSGSRSNATRRPLSTKCTRESSRPATARKRSRGRLSRTSAKATVLDPDDNVVDLLFALS